MSVKPEKFVDVYKKNFLSYSLKAITDRAIPAVQDGLKPVQRRILWLMWTSKMLPNMSFKKSIRVVGDVLGKYHPHSDGSVYGALANLTSEYVMSEFIETQGNFGTRREDQPAAPRYTECKLHDNALKLLLSDLDEDCVNFHPNFDQTLQEPDVLPSKVPVLLLNGTFGIAVGIASSIPSHNLSELITVCEHLLAGNEAAAYAAFNGPDWKSGGRLFFSDEEKKKVFFGDGRGALDLYGTMKQVPAVGRKKIGELHINSLPWTTPRQQFIEQVLKLKTEIPDLEVYRSSKPNEPLVRICTKSDLDRLEQLVFLKTKFSTTYTYNCVFLDGKMPIQGGIKEILTHWLSFRHETVTRRFKHKFEKATHEIEHLTARRILIQDILDDFLKILRFDGKEKASQMLFDHFSKYPEQLGVRAPLPEIIDRLLGLRIASLSKESATDLQIKIEGLQVDAAYYQKIFSIPEETTQYILNELRGLQKIAPERLTEALEEKVTNSTRIADVTTRKVSSPDGTKITLGTGPRMTANESLVMITPAEVYRLRVRDFKVRDGATVDPSTIKQGVQPSVAIATTEKFALVIYESGQAVWLDLEKIKQSATVRKLLPKETILKVLYFESITDDFLFSLTADKKAVAVKVSDLRIAERRAVAKVRLQSSKLQDVLVVSEGQQLRAKFEEGFPLTFPPEQFYQGGFSVRAKMISPGKTLIDLKLDTSDD